MTFPITILPVTIPVGVSSPVIKMLVSATGPALVPGVVVADGFQNDVILFQLQERFEPTSIVRTFTIPNEVQRDFAQFAMVTLSDTVPAFYSIEMTGPLYKKDSVPKVINSTITELLNA